MGRRQWRQPINNDNNDNKNNHKKENNNINLWAAAAAADPSWGSMSGERESRGG